MGFITNTGFADISAAYAANGTSYFGWGSGSGQTATDTDLASPIADSRGLGTATQTTTSVTNDTIKIDGSIIASNPCTVSEVAVFDASTSGHMNFYADFTGVNLGQNDLILFHPQGRAGLVIRGARTSLRHRRHDRAPAWVWRPSISILGPAAHLIKETEIETPN